MNKLFYFAAMLVVTAGCSSHNGENKAGPDDTTASDSIVITDSLQSTTADSTLKSDSINGMVADKTVGEANDSTQATKPSPNAKKIEKELKWFEHDVKQYKDAIRSGMIGYELSELGSPCFKEEKNLKKYEDEMTPEQKKKFKKYQKMLYNR